MTPKFTKEAKLNQAKDIKSSLILTNFSQVISY